MKDLPSGWEYGNCLEDPLSTPPEKGFWFLSDMLSGDNDNDFEDGIRIAMQERERDEGRESENESKSESEREIEIEGYSEYLDFWIRLLQITT